MRNEFFETLQSAVKNWWVSLIIGILFIGAAQLLLFYPQAGYLVLATTFSILMFAIGLFEIIFSVSNKNILPGWGWYLAFGIIDLLLGCFLLFMPGLAEGILPFLLAFWLIFRGMSTLGQSIEMQRYGSHSWGWYLALSILSIICGIGVIFFPVAGAFSVLYIVAFMFLFLGLARIMLAFDLKKLHADSKKIEERINEWERKYKE
jgi:Uncharacterized conserved protein